MGNRDRDQSKQRDFIRTKPNAPAQIPIETDGELDFKAICNDLSVDI
jgi:hypothetical protein